MTREIPVTRPEHRSGHPGPRRADLYRRRGMVQSCRAGSEGYAGDPDVTVVEMTGRNGLSLLFHAEDASDLVYVTVHGQRGGAHGTVTVGREVIGELARVLIEYGVHLHSDGKEDGDE